MQYIVKLKFTSPLHIGKGKPDYYAETNSVLHSDTLKSALFATAKLADKELSVENFWDKFIVSSSMPFYNEYLFLPKPNLNKLNCKIWDQTDYKDCSDLKFVKKIKKVQYIQQSVFEQMNTGKILKFENYQFAGNLLWDKETVEKIVLQEFSNADKEKFKKFPDTVKRQIINQYQKKLAIFKKGIQERVKIYAVPEYEDGKPISSRPYNLERLYFTNNSGLYFIVDVFDNDNKEEIKKHIIDALNILKDYGFGTDKSVGNGQFEYEIKEFSGWQNPEDIKYKMNLSLFLPDMDKSKKEDFLRYQIIERGGYIANQIDYEHIGVLRNTVSMFDVASVFDKEMQDIGKYVDLKPENLQQSKAVPHKVLRDGRAIFIPINFNSEINEG